MASIALAIGATTTLNAEAQAVYSAGQVWEYKVRPGDEGSLLRIAKVEDNPAFSKLGPIYHVSVIKVRLGPDHQPGVVGHLPVSKETLDKSVIRVVTSEESFPDPEGGMAEWRNAKGGVFTISMSEIVAVIDDMTRKMPSDPK